MTTASIKWFFLLDCIITAEQRGHHAPKQPSSNQTWAVTPSLSQVSHQSSWLRSDLVTRSEISLMCTLSYPSGGSTQCDLMSESAVKWRETLWWVWQVELTPGRKQRRPV